MVQELNSNRAGLALGTLFAIFHFIWLILIGINFGQTSANIWHSMHFISDMHTIEAFSFGTALIGLILAFVAGYVIGWLFAYLYNKFK